MPKFCSAFYDGDGPSSKTHTCDKWSRHDGPHRCPDCGAMWTREGEADDA